jgi:hypothetical protein
MNSSAFPSKLAMLTLTSIVFVGCSLFVGCSSRTIPADLALLAAAKVTGKIHGGEQPVAGATIQLFDATDGGAPLISSPPVSDANGNFTITGLWSASNCQPSDQLYIVAQGGNPGSGENDDLLLMSAVGTCADLTASSSVSINEVTTVATIVAFQNFFDPTYSTTGGYIWGGDTPEYSHFLAMVDPGAGVAQPGPNQLMLDALANSITPCVNLASNNGDNWQCDGLINDSGNEWRFAGVPLDSAVAVYSVIGQPTYAPTNVFNYAPSNPPFVPTLVSAPSSWIFQ